MLICVSSGHPCQFTYLQRRATRHFTDACALVRRSRHVVWVSGHAITLFFAASFLVRAAMVLSSGSQAKSSVGTLGGDLHPAAEKLPQHLRVNRRNRSSSGTLLIGSGLGLRQVVIAWAPGHALVRVWLQRKPCERPQLEKTRLCKHMRDETTDGLYNSCDRM